MSLYDFRIPKQTVVPVAPTGSSVLSANPSRVYAIIVNDSDTKVYLQFGEKLGAGMGLPIEPGGGYEMSVGAQNIFRGPLYAVHSGTGNKNLNVIEGD